MATRDEDEDDIAIEDDGDEVQEVSADEDADDGQGASSGHVSRGRGRGVRGRASSGGGRPRAARGRGASSAAEPGRSAGRGRGAGSPHHAAGDADDDDDVVALDDDGEEDEEDIDGDGDDAEDEDDNDGEQGRADEDEEEDDDPSSSSPFRVRTGMDLESRRKKSWKAAVKKLQPVIRIAKREALKEARAAAGSSSSSRPPEDERVLLPAEQCGVIVVCLLISGTFQTQGAWTAWYKKAQSEGFGNNIKFVIHASNIDKPDREQMTLFWQEVDAVQVPTLETAWGDMSLVEVEANLYDVATREFPEASHLWLVSEKTIPAQQPSELCRTVSKLLEGESCLSAECTRVAGSLQRSVLQEYSLPIMVASQFKLLHASHWGSIRDIVRLLINGYRDWSVTEMGVTWPQYCRRRKGGAPDEWLIPTVLAHKCSSSVQFYGPVCPMWIKEHSGSRCMHAAELDDQYALGSLRERLTTNRNRQDYLIEQAIEDSKGYIFLGMRKFRDSDALEVVMGEADLVDTHKQRPASGRVTGLHVAGLHSHASSLAASKGRTLTKTSLKAGQELSPGLAGSWAAYSSSSASSK